MGDFSFVAVYFLKYFLTGIKMKLTIFNNQKEKIIVTFLGGTLTIQTYWTNSHIECVKMSAGKVAGRGLDVRDEVGNRKNCWNVKGNIFHWGLWQG